MQIEQRRLLIKGYDNPNWIHKKMENIVDDKQNVGTIGQATS
jgi:hypothetical protein